jgi:hypothetical protein
MAPTQQRDRPSPPPPEAFTTRHGRLVAAHYGSAAGELAVCVRAVGVVERADLAVLSLGGTPEHLADVATRLAGHPIAPGGAAEIRGAWWCGAAPGELLLMAGAPTIARLREALRADAFRSARFALLDRTATFATLGIVGRRAGALLAALGAYGPGGDPRAVAPFRSGRLASAEVRWLLQSDRAALVLVPRDRADACRRAIDAAGRPLGLGAIGHDALERFALLDRARVRGGLALSA